jgi:glycogen debranching enzyme
MAEPEVVRVRGKGVSLRLTKEDNVEALAQPAADDRWEINVSSRNVKYMITPLRGFMTVDAPWKLTGNFHHRCPEMSVTFSAGLTGRTFEAAVEEFESEWEKRRYRKTFARCAQSVQREFDSWRKKLPRVPRPYLHTAHLGAYIMWSAVVRPSGLLKRNAMYMSKNWMIQVWPWDNCFNAWAMARGNSGEAWDQFIIAFDTQHSQGCLADASNDRRISWSFPKPPVHGWVLLKMMRCNRFFTARRRLLEAYGALSRWTEWWFTYRDTTGSGLAEYKHGNDSGWDNCTLFEGGTPVKGPELAAYLALQMEALADIARRLGRKRDAARWKQRSDRQIALLVKNLWNGERFVAPRATDGKCVNSDSLFALLPIVLGKRLPAGIRTKLIAAIKERGRFLTRWGLATESLKSSRYIADGYWRGPIWAPSTMIIIDGLVACGEKALASTIAKRFCNLVKKSGMAENFDSLSGQGLRDPAYTWTPAVFFILASEYLEG